MRIGAIFFFILSSYHLIQLIMGNSYSGAKVIVDSNTQTIIMQTMLVLLLGYLSIKLKWD